jgi:two-component system, cell cycle sensor histidine kinase PleC
MQPFRQIDNRLARKYAGTGLGLPLVKSLVEMHGGEFRLNSMPGEGTTATIVLPPERLIRHLQTAPAQAADGKSAA